MKSVVRSGIAITSMHLIKLNSVEQNEYSLQNMLNKWVLQHRPHNRHNTSMCDLFLHECNALILKGNRNYIRRYYLCLSETVSCHSCEIMTMQLAPIHAPTLLVNNSLHPIKCISLFLQPLLLTPSPSPSSEM
ncbi:hypothetical protein GOODEAATRI_031153 [Goodea atripinnis]|uniref:Uncharacterized protein n=1 Tax=Goodea atripinnis TaxID=208336 RepID=A0ABV0PT41_9TELE